MVDFGIFLSDVVQAVGLTIIDTLWQGLLIGLVLFILLGLVRSNASTIRYRLSLLALLMMLVCTANSFIHHLMASGQPTILGSNLSLIFLKSQGAANADGSLMQDHGIVAFLLSIKDFLYQRTSLITAIWLCGVVLLYLKLLGGVIYIRQLKDRCREVTDGFWKRQLAGLTTLVGVNKLPQLMESEMVGAPMTIGYLRPIIIFPIGMLTGVPTAQLELILVHELVHIKKADYIINIFQSLVEIIFFYHPTTWFISHMIQQERENRCDQITVKLTHQPLAYAQALTTVNENNNYLKSKLAMSIQSEKRDLTMRIFRILNIKDPKPRNHRLVAATLILLMAVSFFSFYTPQKLPGETLTTVEASNADKSSETANLPANDLDIEAQVKNSLKISGDNSSSSANKAQPDATFLQESMEVKATAQPGDTTGKKLRIRTENGLSPIYYLDDKKIDEKDFEAVEVENIASVEVLKGEKALEKFGPEAKNGVVLIYTKLSKSARELEKRLHLMEKQAKEKAKKEQLQKFEFSADEMALVDPENDKIELQGNVKIKAVDKVSSEAKLVVTSNHVMQSALFVVDGKESQKTWNELEKILSVTEISRVNVLRGEPAIAKYGKKGANGVVEITTKKKLSHDKDITTAVRQADVFPNPSSGDFNIRLKLEQKSKVNIRLYDLNGKLMDKILRKSLNKGAHIIGWKPENISPGNYILHINTGRELLKRQIIIKK
ncbi:M56 family metallopeptidase [Fulvivirgaceae bacterium BMA12]|uniref:M56 family metallopeptidase n=1 Tax=Agaribacillus aureus TaxID=3051825 RepID=A0ABT8LES1_9BACT|nr:M56 family metallopeptidase [Fulvivirgaceae bacterium BMA12]